MKRISIVLFLCVWAVLSSWAQTYKYEEIHESPLCNAKGGSTPISRFEGVAAGFWCCRQWSGALYRSF